MTHLSFSANPATKCATQIFSDIRLHEPGKLIPGEKKNIWYRGSDLGEAEIKSFVNFYYENINDTISFLAFGKDSLSVKAMLSRFYPAVQPKTIFTFITLEWVTRNMAAQEPLVAEWWGSLNSQYNNPKQVPLFND